jgi:pilus assembly protein FimV
LKKTALYAALFTLTVPLSLYGIGLGQMTIKSALDQPFLAEIELIDVGNAPITGIKVGIADPENFEQIGIEPIAALSLLSFTVEKNTLGKPVIKVQSQERMIEPYMELVVDLTWPEGQLYKAYTVLLDPPGYQLVSSIIQGSPTHYKQSAHVRKEPGVIDKTVITTVERNAVDVKDNKKQSTYGPTVTNENVWQIAQRYKTSSVTLPQVVLAIVGTNPDAFKEDNLNGLKVGVRLTIPATEDIALVSSELSTAEIMAHDKAWNEKTAINHVISPPYMNNQLTSQLNTPPLTINTPEVSSITKVYFPAVVPQNPLPGLINNNSNLPANNTDGLPTGPNPQNTEARTKAELSIAVTAVESVRESNALLMEQLHLLQDQNKKLQQQLDNSTAEMQSIRSQMQVMVTQRQAVASQASTATPVDSSSDSWTLFILLITVVAGGAAYWYFKMRNKESFLINTVTPLMDPQSRDVEKAPDEMSTIQPVDESQTHPSVNEEVASINNFSSEALKSSTDTIGTDEDSAAELSERNEFFEPQFKHEDRSSNSSPNKEYDLSADDSSVNIDHEDVIQPEHSDLPSAEMGFETASINIDEVPTLPEESPPLKEVIEESNEKLSEKESTGEDLLEFETGLHNLISEKPKSVTKKSAEQEHDGIDFIHGLSEKVNHIEQSEPQEKITTPEFNASEEFTINSNSEPTVVQSEEKTPEIDDPLTQFFVENTPPQEQNIEESTTGKTNPLKSKKALDTLLALAQTYISMDDIDSARHSLEEVLEHGSDDQKTNATRLLDQIKDK